MQSSVHVVPPRRHTADAYDAELRLRLGVLRSERAGEFARLGWFTRRRRERELQHWVESELSYLVRAGKLPPKRSWLAALLFAGEPPVIH